VSWFGPLDGLHGIYSVMAVVTLICHPPRLSAEALANIGLEHRRLPAAQVNYWLSIVIAPRQDHVCAEACANDGLLPVPKCRSVLHLALKTPDSLAHIRCPAER